jgi:hypothetical protein
MRIFTPIAVGIAIPLSAAPDILARQSPAASQEATGAITGRVTVENEEAPGVAVTLQRETSGWPCLHPWRGRPRTKKAAFK